MKRSLFFNPLVAFALIITFITAPRVASATQQLQTGTSITGDGQFTEPVAGPCGRFSITFDPAGGPVTGTLQINCHIYNDIGGGILGEEVGEGTLAGTFEGGDGGIVHGQQHLSGQWIRLRSHRHRGNRQ